MSGIISKECSGLRNHIHFHNKVLSSLLSGVSLSKWLGIVYSDLDVTITKGSRHSVGEYSVVGEGAPSQLYAGVCVYHIIIII